MSNSSSLQRIEDLKAEIASLEQAAISELKERRNALARELSSIDSQLAALTGKPLEAKPSHSRAPKTAGKSLPLQELKELLANAPGKTLSIRKERLELANIKTLATANPQLLKLGGKGPWPTVTLLK